MEPERNIEKLLRSFARFRRSQAGDPAKGADPFALHPATRRLLQGEVLRRAPKSGAAAVPWFWRFHTMLTGALVIAGLLALAAMLLPALGKAKQKAQSVTAMSQLHQIGVAAQLAAADNSGKLPATLDELTNNIIRDPKLLVDPQSGQPFTYVGGGKYLGSLSSNAVLAYAPEQKQRRAVLLANGSVASYSDKDFSLLTNPMDGELAANKQMPADAAFDLAGRNAPIAPAAPVQMDKKLALSDQAKSDRSVAINDSLAKTSDTGLAAAIPLGANQSTQMFVALERAEALSLANNNSQLYRNQADAQRQAPLLGKFQWQQNGNAIRVVDTDGSVYEGSLTNIAANAVITVAPQQADNLAANNAGQNVQNAPAQSGVSFQVRGRNQTLKQNVVFAGNFIPVPGAGNDAQAIGGAQAANNAQQFASVNNNANYAKTVNGQNATQAGLANNFGGGARGGNNRNGTFQNGVANNQAAANQSATQLNWSNTRIIGTVQLENTNQFDIDAVPAAQ